MHISIKALVVITSMVTIGCYSNWHDLDSFVAKISCDSTQQKITELVQLNLIKHEWDQTSYVLSIYKNSDALAVTFNKKGNLLSVAVSKSQIKLLGFFRKQSSAVITLNCQKIKIKT